MICYWEIPITEIIANAQKLTGSMRFVLYALENESKLDFSLYAGNKKDTIVDGEWKIIKVHPNINLV